MTFQLSQGGLTNEGFNNQGHFPEEFYIQYILTVAQWVHSKKKKKKILRVF